MNRRQPLPKADPGRAAEESWAQPMGEHPEAGNSLLLLCEDGLFALDLEGRLRTGGYDVRIETTLSVIRLAPRAVPYALAVIEIPSATSDGYSACAALRAVSTLPILLILRDTGRHDVLRGFQYGADAYLMAPFDPRELIARVESLLRRASHKTLIL